MSGSAIHPHSTAAEVSAQIHSLPRAGSLVFGRRQYFPMLQITLLGGWCYPHHWTRSRRSTEQCHWGNAKSWLGNEPQENSENYHRSKIWKDYLAGTLQNDAQISFEQIILYIAETQSRNTENYWSVMVSEAIYTIFGPDMKIIIQYNKEKKRSGGNGAFLHSHRPIKTKRKQEKTGQIVLGNNSGPLLWAQQVSLYEQLTQEENGCFTDWSSRNVKEKLQWKATSFEMAEQTFLTYQRKRGASNMLNQWMYLWCWKNNQLKKSFFWLLGSIQRFHIVL